MTIRRMSPVLGLLSLFALAPAATANLPPQDDAGERMIRGRLLVQNDCYMCHTAEIIASQRLTADQWKAELTKMIGWGAPVTPEENPILLDYLMTAYGPDVPAVRPGRTTIAAAGESLRPRDDPSNFKGRPGDVARGGRLFAEHCAACHGADALGGNGGTNLVERPVLDRWTDYDEVVRNGRNRMPGFRAVLDEAKEIDLLHWLRGRHPASKPAK